MPAPTEQELRDAFDSAEPCKMQSCEMRRRVEKNELSAWLKDVGDREFIDELGADENVDALWNEKRYRNAHLIAAVTHEVLVDCGYADGEAMTILKYLRPDGVPAAPLGMPHTITAVLQPDPNADARSQAQSEALSKALTVAVAGRDSLAKLIGGENRRPTVGEARKYVGDASSKAARLDVQLSAAVDKIYSDPHANVTGMLLGAAGMDKEFYTMVHKSLSQAQYRKFGAGVTGSGVLLLQAVLKYAIDIDNKLYMQRYAKCESVGRTYNAVSMTKRLKLLDEALTEVRYSPKFDITEALDMVYNAVSPVPSLMMEAMNKWHASAKGQDDFDEVMLQAQEKAEAYVAASDSTQNTPRQNNRTKQVQQPQQHTAQPGRARMQSNWRGRQSRQTNTTVNAVEFQKMRTDMSQLQQLLQAEREKVQSLECNMVQMYADLEGVDLNGTHDREEPVSHDAIAIAPAATPVIDCSSSVDDCPDSNKNCPNSVVNSKHYADVGGYTDAV